MKYTTALLLHKHIKTVLSQSSHCTKSKTCITWTNFEISQFKKTVSKGHFSFCIIQTFSRVSFIPWEPRITMTVLSPEHVGISYVKVFSKPSPKTPIFLHISHASEFELFFANCKLYLWLDISPMLLNIQHNSWNTEIRPMYVRSISIRIVSSSWCKHQNKVYHRLEKKICILHTFFSTCKPHIPIIINSWNTEIHPMYVRSICIRILSSSWCKHQIKVHHRLKKSLHGTHFF
jgi:hypothetical protein